jgi:hypothetical protein
MKRGNQEGVKELRLVMQWEMTTRFYDDDNPGHQRLARRLVEKLKRVRINAPRRKPEPTMTGMMIRQMAKIW